MHRRTHLGATWRGLGSTLIGFMALWLLLDRSAAWLGSFRGEAGLLVCAIFLGGAVLVELATDPRPPLRALGDLGLKVPTPRVLLAALLLGAALLCTYPVFALVSGTRLEVRPDAAILMLGVFAQGGVAEEVLFRGYLFRRLRRGRGFWGAACLACVPFVAVHVPLFFTLALPIALASLALALSLSFPLAWLFERSGGSIWPPAIVHAVIQGSIKMIDAGGDTLTLASVWMLVSALGPWAVLLRGRK